MRLTPTDGRGRRATLRGTRPACVARRGGATFRDVLRAFRLGAGLTQADLARRAGVPAKTVNNYQRGSRPTGRVLTKLVRVLGPGLVVQEGRAAP